MEKILSQYTEWLRLGVAVVLMAASLIVSGLINIPYAPVGLLLVVLVNWVMFRSEKLDLSALGFDLKLRHLRLIPLGLIAAFLAYLFCYALGAYIRGNDLHLNSAIDWKAFFIKFWLVLPTAAVQDFLVVGYCYHKLIRLTNVRLATLVVGLRFVSMHDVWGSNIIDNLFLMLTTFAGYLMFSTALLRSGSIWLAVGLHWGNNFTNSSIFTYKPTATSWLYLHGSLGVSSIWQAIALLVVLPLSSILVILLVKAIWRKRQLFA